MTTVCGTQNWDEVFAYNRIVIVCQTLLQSREVRVSGVMYSFVLPAVNNYGDKMHANFLRICILFYMRKTIV